jgi:hypothetical protein
MANTVRLRAEYRETRIDVGRMSELDRASSAYALSAAVTVVFSTILTWAKETYAPLHDFMASLTGHHWTTHGIAAVAVFLLLGLAFLNWRVAERISPHRLIVALIGAVMAAGVGLVGFFALF